MPTPIAPAPSPAPDLTPAERGRMRGVFLFLFAGCVTGSIGLGIRLDDWLTLRSLYGAERVRREHLHILPGKPVRVSNGDELGKGPQPFDWILPVSLFVVGGGGTLAALRLLPRRCRLAMRRTGNDEAYEPQPPAARLPGLATLLTLFLLNGGARWRWYAPYLSAATAAAAVATCRLKYARHP